MNKKSIITAALALTALAAPADDKMYINDFSISKGETKTVSLMLDNDKTYCAFQTDLRLPDGVEVVTEDGEYVVDLSTRKNRTHVVSTNLLANGALRIFVTSQSSQTFTGTSGAIATVTLKATKNVRGSRAQLIGTVLVEEDGTRNALPVSRTNVNGGPDIADVNDDGRVDVGDVNAVLAMILAGDSDPIGNVNGDATVDVGDVNAILAAILTQ